MWVCACQIGTDGNPFQLLDPLIFTLLHFQMRERKREARVLGFQRIEEQVG